MTRLHFLRPPSFQDQSPRPLQAFLSTGAVALPLLFYTDVFTGLHYGDPVRDPWLGSLETMIAVYTYGYDRFQDAMEFEIYPVSTSKAGFYRSLLSIRKEINLVLNVLFGFIVGILITYEDRGLPFLGLLGSTWAYKPLKSLLPIIKPWYLSTMWTIAAIIMPSILTRDDLGIGQDVMCWLPMFLMIFASSNSLDVQDVLEDQENGLRTLPVLMGKDPSMILNQGLVVGAMLLFFLHPHFWDRQVENAIFLLQSFGFLIYLRKENHQ